MMGIAKDVIKTRKTYAQDNEERAEKIERINSQTLKNADPSHEESSSDNSKPRVGRPRRKDQSKNRNEQMTIIMTSKLKSAIKAYAYEKRISVADFIDEISKEALKKHGFWDED